MCPNPTITSRPLNQNSEIWTAVKMDVLETGTSLDSKYGQIAINQKAEGHQHWDAFWISFWPKALFLFGNFLGEPRVYCRHHRKNSRVLLQRILRPDSPTMTRGQWHAPSATLMKPWLPWRHTRGSLSSPSYLVRNPTLAPQIEKTHETPPFSRHDGLLF